MWRGSVGKVGGVITTTQTPSFGAASISGKGCTRPAFQDHSDLWGPERGKLFAAFHEIEEIMARSIPSIKSPRSPSEWQREDILAKMRANILSF
jgi:hypothetical protein